MKTKKRQTEVIVDETKKSLFLEKIFSKIFLGLIFISLLLFIIMSYSYDNYGSNSLAFKISSKSGALTTVLVIIMGVINSIRPRKCPSCNREMMKVIKDGHVIFQCPICKIEVETHLTDDPL